MERGIVESAMPRNVLKMRDVNQLSKVPIMIKVWFLSGLFQQIRCLKRRTFAS